MSKKESSSGARKHGHWPDLTPDLERNLLREGDVLLGMDGSKVGKNWVRVRQKELPCLLVQRVARLRAKPTMDQGFLRYLIGNPQFRDYVERVRTGTSIPHISGGQIKSYEILLPPISEQKAIASVLGALDDKIELNRRMNATLETMARALFQSWFVDFDPVRAKLDGNQPKGMDAETAALFPDALEHTPDGSLLPRGWSKTNLGKEVQFQTGFSFKSEFFTDSPPGVRVARGMNVKEGEFFWGSQARYWPEITPELEQYRLQSGDVLIGMDGSKVGKNWVRVRASDLPCLLVQRVARLRPASSVGENFIWIAVGSPTFRYYVDAVKTGTSIPHISGGQIKSFEFVRPPLGDNRIFERFESIVAPLSAQVDKNHAESQTLATLRDTLLPKLLSGEMSATATREPEEVSQ